MLLRKLTAPLILNNQIITKIITTIFKIFLILASIGIYELTKYNTTPITTNTINTVNKFIIFFLVAYRGIEPPLGVYETLMHLYNLTQFVHHSRFELEFQTPNGSAN